jgi:hypothetical protein
MVSENTIYINNISVLNELLRKSLPYKTILGGSGGIHEGQPTI